MGVAKTVSGCWLAALLALSGLAGCCHVMPEKVVTRTGLCQGPVMVLPDVGLCGTPLPRFTEDLAFKIFYRWAEVSKTYLLIMVDPDAPMREYPLLADFVHWLIADIPGYDLLSGTVSPLRAKELIEYRPPSPPAGSGYHRYQFFLFETPEDATAGDIIGYNPANRVRFNLQDFVVANSMCYNLRATFEFSQEEVKYAMARMMGVR